MICICDACHHIFNSAYTHSKYPIPKRCLRCRKMNVCIDGEKTVAVRIAVGEKIKRYRDWQRSQLDMVCAKMHS